MSRVPSRLPGCAWIVSWHSLLRCGALLRCWGLPNGLASLAELTRVCFLLGHATKLEVCTPVQALGVQV